MSDNENAVKFLHFSLHPITRTHTHRHTQSTLDVDGNSDADFVVAKYICAVTDAATLHFECAFLWLVSLIDTFSLSPSHSLCSISVPRLRLRNYNTFMKYGFVRNCPMRYAYSTSFPYRFVLTLDYINVNNSPIFFWLVHFAASMFILSSTNIAVFSFIVFVLFTSFQQMASSRQKANYL